MRLVKLTLEMLNLSVQRETDEATLNAFFDEDLPSRNPPGLFPFPQGRIRADGTHAGETVLFSFDNRLRFVVKAKTGRKENTYLLQDECPHCFEIEMASLRRTNVALIEVERRLTSEVGLRKSMLDQGWTIVPDSDHSERIIDSLVQARPS